MGTPKARRGCLSGWRCRSLHFPAASHNSRNAINLNLIHAAWLCCSPYKLSPSCCSLTLMMVWDWLFLERFWEVHISKHIGCVSWVWTEDLWVWAAIKSPSSLWCHFDRWGRGVVCNLFCLGTGGLSCSCRLCLDMVLFEKSLKSVEMKYGRSCTRGCPLNTGGSHMTLA